MPFAFSLTYGLVALAGSSGDGVTAEGLNLTVTPAKQENILHEPVVFRVVLENVGRKPVVIVSPWVRDMGLQVQIAQQPLSKDGVDGRAPPPSEFRAYLHGLGPADGGWVARVLRSGDRLEHVEAILWYWHAKEYFMKSPGLLWIKARYRFHEDPDKYVESAPVAVRFNQVPQRERKVLKLWATAEAASVVQYGTIGGITKYRTTRERLEAAEHANQDLGKIVAQHPESLYAFYAQLALSKPAKWADVAFEGLRSLAPGAEPDLALVERAERLVAERERRKNMLFPDDDRLAAQVRYDLEEVTPLEELLAVASKQTKVPLNVVESLRGQTWIISGRLAADDAALRELFAQFGPEERVVVFRPLKDSCSLRELMKHVSVTVPPVRDWAPYKNGYVLTTTKHSRILRQRKGEDELDADLESHRRP